MDTDKWCPDMLIPTIAILAIIFVMGGVGNICICLVIIRTKSLHTRANYFLFGLACSDMLLLFLACPLQIYLFINCYTSNNNFVCKLYNYVKDAYGVTSVFIICAFTAERRLAVCHLLRMNELRNLFCAFASVSTVALLIVTGLRMGAVLGGEMNSTFYDYARFSANTSTSSLSDNYQSILEKTTKCAHRLLMRGS
ncbi:unnamed protein product [Cylicocyclus nassatus]|uniref:G-protein coupled receptors family 1 profile domain-containing protein n=1 Tax=Cylicocyclus nassatus TaxID=53992 RepID=A0AA36MCS8_CYLNA|nr:unnamed protein product [Cylicocyclus nassatus]